MSDTVGTPESPAKVPISSTVEAAIVERTDGTGMHIVNLVLTSVSHDEQVVVDTFVMTVDQAAELVDSLHSVVSLSKGYSS